MQVHSRNNVAGLANGSRRTKGTPWPPLSYRLPLRGLILVLVATCLASAAGCVQSPPPPVGEVAYDSGEIRAVEKVSLPRARRAVEEVKKKLFLTEMNFKSDGLSTTLVFLNAKNHNIRVHLESLTSSETEIRVRYGLLGDEDKARALLNEIKAQL